MELFGIFNYEATQDVYKCNVTRVINWKVDEEILRTVGDHQEDKTNDNLAAISFKNLIIERFPRRLETFFPNLKTLTINSCEPPKIGFNRTKQLKTTQFKR